MKLFILVLLGLLSFNIFAVSKKCAAITKDNICIELEWSQKVELGTFLENTVRFKDLNLSDDTRTVYVSVEKKVEFYGWMIMHHHAHGTRPVETKKVAAGVFHNSKIFFMKGMTGTWQFKVKIGDEDFVLYSLDV